MARDSFDETLSVKQANSVGDYVNSAVSKAIRDMESASNEFLAAMKDKWADENAVKVAQAVSKAMKDVTDTTNKNNGSFFSGIKSAVSTWAKAAKKSVSFGVDPVNLAAAINAGVVKSAFEDGSFGFKDVNANVSEILDSYETFKKEVKRAESELNSKLKSANVFGNRAAQIALANAGSKIFDILHQALDQVDKDLNVCLNNSKQTYTKLGSSTEEAFRGMTNTTQSK